MLSTVLECMNQEWIAFLMMASVLPPMLWPVWRARRPLRLGHVGSYLTQLWAALVVCGLSSWLLWPFLFGDGLQQGSTAGFIFLVAPIYGVMSLFAAYGLGELVGRTVLIGREWGIPIVAMLLYWLPVSLLAIMLLGILITSARLCKV
jgi:hypothetical protein